MRLREAEKGDSLMLFEWANDKEVRRMAFSSEPIGWESHNRWFRRKLESPQTKIWIAIGDEGEPLGQIRFDAVSDREAELSVNVKPRLRGRGLGVDIILLGVQKCFSETIVNQIVARVKINNIPSRKTFEKCGFRKISREIVRGQECVRMIKVKEEAKFE